MPLPASLSERSHSRRCNISRSRCLRWIGCESGAEQALATRVTAARVSPQSAIAAGGQVRVRVEPGRLHFFDPDTENAITA